MEEPKDRGSMEISATFDLLAARADDGWKWEDYSLGRLRARGVDWLEVTSAAVYLESPVLGRDARFGCLLVFIAIATYHIVEALQFENKTWMVIDIALSAYGFICVGLFVIFHKMHRPMLSDWMLVFAMFTDMLWDPQVFTTMVLCQSHPLPVTVGAMIMCVKDEWRGWCAPNVVLCPGLWMDRLFMFSFYTMAVVIHCIDYTSRVRFVESGAPCEVDAPWDSRNYQESRICRLFASAWKWLRWSAHPVFLNSPVAGRTCRRASTLLAIFPLWNIWFFFRCKLHYWFPERGSLPTDLAVAALTVLLPALATFALQRYRLLSAAIASDVGLASFVIGAWGLLLCQCLPVPPILLTKTRNLDYVIFRILRAQDMTIVGLALTGIHPVVCVQVYIGCCVLEMFRKSLPQYYLSWLEATITGLFCFCQSCSFFWRLRVIKNEMAKTQANAAASSMIQDINKSWSSRSPSPRKSKSHVDFEQDSELEMRRRDRLLDEDPEAGLLAGERSAHRLTKAGGFSPNGNSLMAPRRERPRGPRPRSGRMIAVIRHGERADSGFESNWPGSRDSERHPFDPPLTETGFHQARETAMKLKDLGDFHLVVSSPYLRCVQTGLDIAKHLDCALVLDAEAGEVFGPKVFGDVPHFDRDPSGHQERPWRRKASLQKTIGGGKENKVVFWGRVLGTPPEWPESLQNARLRYTKCLLSYMRRGKNIVLVTHQPMIQACLRVIPASSFLEVDRVPYCSGMVAWLHRSAPACLFAARPQEAKRSSSEKGLTRRSSFSEGVTLCTGCTRCVSREEEFEESLHEAGVQWWEVALLGIDAVREDLKKRNKDQVLQSRCYQELGPCWQHVKKLLGGLPNQAMREVPEHRGRREHHEKRDSDSTTRSPKSPASPQSFSGSSFTSTAKSEAWTITSSSASTTVVGALGSSNWQLYVSETGDRTKSPIGTAKRGSGRLSVELDSSFAISPALQQLRQDGNCQPLSRVGDVNLDTSSQSSSDKGPPQFTLTSSLARRRASQHSR